MRTITTGRTVLIALAALAGFVIGFYAGLFLAFSLAGVDGFRGWQASIAALPGAGIGASAAVVLASPTRVIARVAGAVAPVSIVLAAFMIVIDAGFAVAFGLGALVITPTATSAAVSD